MRASQWNPARLSTAAAGVAVAAGALGAAAYASAAAPVLPGTLRTIVSTVPKNGDVNPYGMAFVLDGPSRPG